MDGPEHASQFRDRHGHLRWRFRKAGRDVYLPGNPGEEEFERSYLAALQGRRLARADRITRRQIEMTMNFRRQYIAPALKRARTRAVRQRVAFELDATFLSDLLDQQNWKCAVSAIPFPLDKVDERSEQAFRPSLDRIEPKKGYVRGNVRIVCEIVNLAMNDWGEQPLLQLVRRMKAGRVST